MTTNTRIPKAVRLPSSLALVAAIGLTASARADLPPVTTGLVAQYDAQAITGLANGDTVNTWNDTSGANNHATRTGGTPTYQTAVFHGRPVVRFPDDGQSYFNFTRRTDLRTIFWVVKDSRTRDYQFLLGDSSNYDFHRGAAGNIWSQWTSGAITGGTTRLNGTAINGTTTALAPNTWSMLNVITTGNVAASSICRDRTIANRSWGGDIAEILLYNTALSAAQVQAVEFYLINKWFTPPNTVATPVISPPSGTYLSSVNATIACPTPGASILYTTDDWATSQPYNDPVVIPAAATTVLKAKATLATFTDSEVATATYTIVPGGNGTWTNPAGGSWVTAGNWQGGVIASDAGNTADFSTLTLAGNATVTMDAAVTIGALLFDDQNAVKNGWTLNAGAGNPALTLATVTGKPTVSNNANVTLNPLITGTQGLEKTGTGTLTLGRANSYSGGTTITAGTIASKNVNTPCGTGTITIEPAGTFTFNTDGGQFPVLPNAIAGSGVFNTAAVSGSQPFYTGDWSGFSGTVNATSIQIGTAANTGSAQMKLNLGGYISLYQYQNENNITRTFHIGELSGTGPVQGAAPGLTNTITVSIGALGTDSVYGGVFQDSYNDNHTGKLAVTKVGVGTLTLTGSSRHTGATTVNGGTLQINGTLGASGTQTAVTVNATGTLRGTGTITGPVTVNADATLAAGSADVIGTLNITGNLVTTGTCLFRIDKTGFFAESDLIRGMGGMTAGGKLKVVNITSDGTPLANGDSFTLLSLGSGIFSGSFASTDLPELPTGLNWDLSQLNVDGSIRVVSTAAAPVFDPPAGGYIGALAVKLSGGPNSTIYYSANGGPWGTYSAPIPVAVNTSVTIQAYASQPGFANSEIVTATYQTLDAPVWTNAAGGSWANPDNWELGVIANGSGITADFSTLWLDTNATVTVDGTWTVGSLSFADLGELYNWTLNPGTGSPITLAGGVSTISVANPLVTINAAFTGANSVEKTGPGTLGLYGVSSYTGGTTITEGGIISKNVNTPCGTGTITIGPDAFFTFNTDGGQFPVVPNALAGSGVLNTAAVSGSQPYYIGDWSGFSGAINATSIQIGTAANTGSTAMKLNLSGYISLYQYQSENNITRTFHIGELSGFGPVQGAAPGLTNTITVSIGALGTDSLYSGIFQDSYNDNHTGKLAVTKVGGGVLTLTGAGRNTGASKVTGGTLNINGNRSTGTGPIAVDSGATLGGTGTLGGATTLASGATLAPGDSFGTLAAAADVSFAAGSTFAVEIDSDFNESDRLAVTGNLDLGNATLAVTNLGAGAPTNGSRFVIATYTGTLTGTFNGLPDGGTVPVGGTDLTIRYADGGNNITLSLGTPFSKWMTDNYPELTGDDALPGADPDGDGLSNIGEFAFKGDPTQGGSRGLIAVTTIDTNGNTTKELTLTLAVRTGAIFTGTPSLTATVQGVTYTAQGSLDLADAFVAPVTELTPALTPAQTGLPDITGSGWEYHSFILTGSDGLPNEGFLRAKAEGQ